MEIKNISNSEFLKLTLESQPNQLNDIKLIETVPTETLKLLINSSLLKQSFNNPFSSICFDNEKQQLEKYNLIIKKGEATINYTQTKNMKYGRVFPKSALGLFSIRREIRHTLARDNYIDIDVDNCHPVLLYQICEHNNIQCKYLKRYIDKRADLLSEVMTTYNVTKDDAKQLFIQLLYFGTFESWCKNHNIEGKEPLKFITKFKRELNMIGEIIVVNNPKLSKDIQKRKEEQNIKDYNIKGSVCSYYLQEYESRILETIYLYCYEKKIIKNNCVLCADGLMIPKSNYKSELLIEFKNVVLEKLGFNVNFSNKEMNQGYTIEQLKETQIKTVLLNDEWDLSEAEFAKALKRVCFDDKPVLFTGKGREPEGFLYNGVFWNPLSLHHAELKQLHFDNLYNDYLKKLNDIKNDTDDKTYNRLLNLIRTLNTNKTRENVIKIFKSDNYIEDVKWNKNIHLFVFNDCIYDLSKGEFVEPNITDYINISCGYDYNSEITNLKETKKDIIKIFKSIVKNDQYKYFMKTIASFLIQNNIEEKAYFWLGKGRNGKGTMTTLLRNTLKNYWGELNTEYYTTHKHRADEPNQNLFNCQNSRVLNTSEVAKDDKSNSKVKFINDAFNRITGNDIINARELGEKRVASFKAGKVLIQLNDMPEFSKDINKKDVSLRERIIIIEMPYSFVEDDTQIKAEPNIYKPIDRTIKQKFETDIYRRAMIDILFENYKLYISEGLIIPESVKNYTNSYFGTQSILGWFNNSYIVNDISKLSIDDIQNDYKNEFNINISKSDLRKKLTDEGLNVVKVKGFFYVKGYKREEKIKEDEDNDDEELKEQDQEQERELEDDDDEEEEKISLLDRL